ncbi:DUF4351 domain-containing protein [Castellaniella sp.]|uniref:DUF4351 domain-containing protein n=1 Tax=Castellaniella sp. TaxID=1955812 RepID=UPI002AFE8D46|nr:DUF4351 domain-containing protein [Castellaniella sp.]
MTLRNPSRSAPPPKQDGSASDDFDSPWKQGLELYFAQAVELLAPSLYRIIDWQVPVVFLDKELQAIDIPGKKHRRIVDKLAQVRLRDGSDAWLLVHVEIERHLKGAQAIKAFAWRMYEYRFRIQSRIMVQRQQDQLPRIYSLGVLLESQGVGKELIHTDEYLGQGVQFRFPVVELESWRSRWDELETLAPSNPFAVLIMAQLRANQYPNKRTRLGPKLQLVRQLRQYGYPPHIAVQVYRLVEWVVTLEKDQEPEFVRAVQALSKENEMSYVTLIERAGRDKGFAEGQIEGQIEGKIQGSVEGQAKLLLRLIQRRFGPTTDDVAQRIQAATAAQLETWSLNFVDATELDDVFRD